MPPDSIPNLREIELWRVRAPGDAAAIATDRLVIEEPLEIRLDPGDGSPHRAISITMRTPGHDGELAVGFLHGEGLLRDPADLVSVEPCGTGGNTVRVTLRSGAVDPAGLARLERNFYATSSCGVCGKASLEALRAFMPRSPQQTGAEARSGAGIETAHAHRAPSPRISAAWIAELPDRLRREQQAFDASGGVHATGIFPVARGGSALVVREDVGRHNALDKAIGAAWLGGWRGRLRESVAVLSGRISFELVQKASVAGVPVVVAVGAPSSLAVELAREADITLAGFARGGSFNIYCGMERVVE